MPPLIAEITTKFLGSFPKIQKTMLEIRRQRVHYVAILLKKGIALMEISASSLMEQMNWSVILIVSCPTKLDLAILLLRRVFAYTVNAVISYTKPSKKKTPKIVFISIEKLFIRSGNLINQEYFQCSYTSEWYYIILYLCLYTYWITVKKHNYSNHI